MHFSHSNILDFCASWKNWCPLIWKRPIHIWGYIGREFQNVCTYFTPGRFRSPLSTPCHFLWNPSNRFHLYVIIRHQIPHRGYLGQIFYGPSACSVFGPRYQHQHLHFTADIAFYQTRNVNLELFSAVLLSLTMKLKACGDKRSIQCQYCAEQFYKRFTNDPPVIKSINDGVYLSSHCRARMRWNEQRVYRTKLARLLSSAIKMT